ncbi:MAG TPA: DUF3037 domain-containing protein [Chloroflexaceae bacterium]|nr:DUF3037 domain-containing protein [Chloroflexaceae bacterium]
MRATAFEYALIRVVPRVERGEFVNVGAVLLCRQRRFLEARLSLEGGRRELLLAMAPGLDVEAVAEQLGLIPLVCAGGRGSGPIGELPLYERFRWLTAPRSTVIQPSPVHVGLCDDPRAALERIYEGLAG